MFTVTGDLCFCFSAKATYAAISETYSYLTPDLWKESQFGKSPYQEFTDHLAKNPPRGAPATDIRMDAFSSS